MKIEYKILWLDDKIQEFIDDELIEEIEDHLKENGFRPKVITLNNVADFDNKLDNSFDLILTDYHLDDFTGDKVVESIRKKSIQTEILFYTARGDLKDINMISRVSFLDTSSKTSSHSDALLNEVLNLIDLTIKKFQHIVAMRGMIMHETSSLDEKMMSILSDFLKNEANKDTVSDMAEDIIQQLKKKFSSKSTCIDKCLKNKNLNKISKDDFIFSSAYKIKTMGHILTSIGLDDFSSLYGEEIVTIRNQFAHATLKCDEETGREYFKKGDVTFDKELCKKIRENIIKHDDHLDKLQKAIEYNIISKS